MKRSTRAVSFVWLLTAMLATLVAWPPAALMQGLVNRHGGLTVVSATGTLWHGQMLLAANGRSLPGWWQWKWSASNLLKGGPSVSLRHPWLDAPLTAQWRWTHWQLSAGRAQIPVATVATILPWFGVLQPDGGELSVQWDAFSTQGTPVRHIMLSWHNASSALAPISPLGSYDCRLRFEPGKPIAAVLSTSAGPLHLEGSGTLQRNGAWQFSGTAQTATAPPSVRDALRPLLRSFGHGNSERALIDWRGP